MDVEDLGRVPLDPASPVTPIDLIARAEARLSYRVRVVLRNLIGRPLRRYPAVPWIPHLAVLGGVSAAAVFATAVWWLFR